ncbi:MAG: hypothetical protein KME13_20360 [Myxacorys californica WJT36-NPBG1]|jgi:hypothetical protein|nr:hypothetical protein [Myxacorys californica WJT36-NPBG1]
MAWSNVASIDVNREWTFTPNIDADLGYFRINFGVGDVRGTLLNQPIWIAQIDLDSVPDSIDIYDERRIIASSFNRVLEFETPAFISNRGLALRSSPDFFDFWNITIEVSTMPLVRSSVPLSPPTSSTVNVSTVGASTTAVSILAANGSRKGATITNNSTATLSIDFAATVTTAAFSLQLFSNDYFEVPYGYTGAISGIWSAVNGNALVREFV